MVSVATTETPKRPGQGYPAVHEIAAWHVAPAIAGARLAIVTSALAFAVAVAALIVAVVR